MTAQPALNSCGNAGRRFGWTASTGVRFPTVPAGSSDGCEADGKDYRCGNPCRQELKTRTIVPGLLTGRSCVGDMKGESVVGGGRPGLGGVPDNFIERIGNSPS
jgi:hypothetical protein